MVLRLGGRQNGRVDVSALTALMGWVLVGVNTTEQSMNGTSEADLVTVSNLNHGAGIPTNRALFYLAEWQRTAGDTTIVGSLGIKLNATTVVGTSISASSAISALSTVSAQESMTGSIFGFFPPRYDGDYLRGGLGLYSYKRSGGNSNSSAGQLISHASDAPNVPITSFTLTARVSDASATISVKAVLIFMSGG